MSYYLFSTKPKCGTMTWIETFGKHLMLTVSQYGLDYIYFNLFNARQYLPSVPTLFT